MLIDFQLRMFETKEGIAEYHFEMTAFDEYGHGIESKTVGPCNTRVGLGMFSAFRTRINRQYNPVQADPDDDDFRQDELPF